MWEDHGGEVQPDRLEVQIGRQERRKTIMHFEDKIAKREECVQSTTDAFEKDSSRLKQDGEDRGELGLCDKKKFSQDGKWDCNNSHPGADPRAPIATLVRLRCVQKNRGR